MSETTLVKQVRVLQKYLWHCLEVQWTSMISSEESHHASSLGPIPEGPSTDGTSEGHSMRCYMLLEYNFREEP